MSRQRDINKLEKDFGVNPDFSELYDPSSGEILEPKNRLDKTITIRADGSRRVQSNNYDPVITDQAAAKDLTMLSIVKKLNQGIQPRLAEGLIYTTDLGIRNLQDVVTRQNEVNDLFYQLPVEIRKLMQHDISNFEKVLFDPENKKILSQYGLIVQKRDSHQELLNAVNSLRIPIPDDQK